MLRTARPAYIALLSVLLVASIAATTILVLFHTGLTVSFMSRDVSQARTAKALTEACAEAALLSLTEGSPLSPQTISDFSYGSCSVVSITNVSGNDWRIRTTGTAQAVTKYFEIEAEHIAGSAATVSSWHECIDATVPCITP